MDFFTLSLPEASGLYLGLAVQALIRGSLVRWVARILLCWIVVLCWRQAREGGNWRLLVGYPVTCVLLCVLLWPETLPFGRRVIPVTDATRVASYAATQDPDADMVTADDVGGIPPMLQQPPLIAPGFRLILRAYTELWLTLGRLINSQSHRTFASLMPMQWLLGVELTADVTTAIGDWVHSCYLPVLTGTMAAAQGRTMEELLPWGNSPVRRELQQRSVTPGANTGISWLRGPNTGNTVPCDVYLDAVEFRTQGWLYELRSPKGTPLSQVFQEELGLESEEQARFLIHREIVRAAGPVVPPPSLAAQYGALRGLSVLGRAGEGAALGATRGGWLGAAFGALAGSLRGVGAEFQQVIEGLSWLVRIAIVGIWYGPYVLGMINLVVLALFPFVFLIALMPQRQYQPLLAYFLILLFTTSAPFWFALVDLIARLAASQVPQVGTGYEAVMFTRMVSGLWVASITAIGMLVVPVAVATVFGVRAFGSLWRGST